MLNIEESAEPMHGVIEGLENRIFGKEPLEAQAVCAERLSSRFRRAPREARWFLMGGAIWRANSRKC